MGKASCSFCEIGIGSFKYQATPVVGGGGGRRGLRTIAAVGRLWAINS